MAIYVNGRDFPTVKRSVHEMFKHFAEHEEDPLALNILAINAGQAAAHLRRMEHCTEGDERVEVTVVRELAETVHRCAYQRALLLTRVPAPPLLLNPN